jgi:hypothetical protein
MGSAAVCTCRERDQEDKEGLAFEERKTNRRQPSEHRNEKERRHAPNATGVQKPRVEQEILETPRTMSSLVSEMKLSKEQRAKLTIFSEKFHRDRMTLKEQRVQSAGLKVQNEELMHEMEKLQESRLQNDKLKELMANLEAAQAALAGENTQLRQELERQKAEADATAKASAAAGEAAEDEEPVGAAPSGAGTTACSSRAGAVHEDFTDSADWYDYGELEDHEDYVGHCDHCKTELALGINWYHKTGSDEDLCRAHWLALPQADRAAFVNVCNCASFGDDGEGYKEEWYLRMWCKDETACYNADATPLDGAAVVASLQAATVDRDDPSAYP